MSTVSPRIPFSTSSGNVNPVQDPDAFPPAQDLTAAEDAELHAQYLARLEDERRAAACVAAFQPLADVAEAVRERLLSQSIFVEAVCRSCGACLLIQVGTPVEQVFCPGCALVEVA